jgi:hypothetical protein
MDFWEFVWGALVIYFYIVFFMVFISCFIDVFRSRDLSGIAKAVWVIVLAVLPIVGVLIYLFARGQGMGERNFKANVEQAETVVAMGGGAASGPSTEIANAKQLLDSGAISEAEYNKLKEKALA